jgi:amino acid transporter
MLFENDSPMAITEGNQQLLQAEVLVEVRDAKLKKELRLGDLVLSQILYITGLSWLGTAGKIGSGHVMFWIPAVLLFYIPSGIVVVHLNQEMPFEGGIYQWAKLRFGEMTGFLVALNLWATMVLLVAAVSPQIVDTLTYLGVATGTWIGGNKWFSIVLGAVLIAGLMAVGRRGLALGKWVHNIGGLFLLIILAGMVLFAVPVWFHGRSAVAPVAFTLPALSLLNLNVLGKMGFAAFCGLDGNSVFAGECRDPNVARTIRRSILLSSPIIASIYIVGTACILTFTAPGNLDLISAAMQVLSKGAAAIGIAAFVAPIAAILLICNLIGTGSIYYNVAIRLPMVAGWDHLLPDWLSRLHPRYRTPVGSIVFIGFTAFALTVLGGLGVGAQEAFQLTLNAAIICWALTYIVMFAIPLIARGERAPWSVRLAAASGLLMTLLFTVLSIFPIIDVRNALSFTAKISGLIVGINVAGALYFSRASKRRKELSPILHASSAL